MTNRFQIDPERAVRLTRFAAIAVGAIFGLAAIAFGGIAIHGNTRAASEEQLAKSLETESEAVRKVLADARSKVAVRVRSQSKAIADFQDSVNSIAHAKSCKVSEFISSTDVQPYLTRFEKQGDGAGWSQIEVQILLSGLGRNIVDVVSHLADQPVPIEFSTIQFTREAVKESGAEVKAKVHLRILVQSAGGPA